MTETRARRFKGQTADERRAERRSRLEAAALDIIGERGWHEATMTEICRVAGLTERYFYESYRSREDLYVVLIERISGELLEATLTAAAAAPDADGARIHAAARAVVAELVGDPRRGRAALMEGIGSSALERRRRQIVLDLAGQIELRWEFLLGPDASTSAQRKLTATAITGATMALIVRRLDGTLEVSDDELAAFIAESGIKLARG